MELTKRQKAEAKMDAAQRIHALACNLFSEVECQEDETTSALACLTANHIQEIADRLFEQGRAMHRAASREEGGVIR